MNIFILDPSPEDAARAAKQDIPCAMVDMKQYAELLGLSRVGEVCKIVPVQRNLRGGSVSCYQVFRWL